MKLNLRLIQQPNIFVLLLLTILYITTAFDASSAQIRARITALHQHPQNHASSPTQVPRVGIVGAGAIALGTAALIVKEHQQNGGPSPMLWSPSGRLKDGATTTFFATFGKSDDELLFSPRIATTTQQLVQENDVILIALPANGHKQIFDEIAPFLNKNQEIIISSHTSLGALYLSQKILQCQGNNANKEVPPITAWGTTVCTARISTKDDDDRQGVRINTVRKSVDLCTIPSEEFYETSLTLCQQLFPKIEFRPRNGLLAISLSNVNPQNHLGIALGNMSRMEKGEQWYQLFHITPNIGRFLEALDQERLEIAKALKVTPVKTIYEHFSNSFHVSMDKSISEMNQEIYASGRDVYGPNTADSRYVTEDVPYGLALTVVLGQLVDRPAMLHQAGILILSSMYGRDFLKENDLLNALALNQYNLEELKMAAYTGRLPSQESNRRHNAQATSTSSPLQQHHSMQKQESPTTASTVN